MCGIIGAFLYEPAAFSLYEGLIHMQHRGQDAAGIITAQQDFHIAKGLGLVSEALKEAELAKLPGSMGIGHTRYPTSGANSLSNVQPFYKSEPIKLALAHSGNLIRIREFFEKAGDFPADSDSYCLLELLSAELLQYSLQDKDLFTSLAAVLGSLFGKLEGSYSVIAMLAEKGLFAFRDPEGIRPLLIARRIHSNAKTEYLFASEPNMFHALGFEFFDDVKPGELVLVDNFGQLHRKTLVSKPFRPCVFEYVYFAKPSSKMDGLNVYQTREEMGRLLAERWLEKFPAVRPDLVVPVPMTSTSTALAFAKATGFPYAEALTVNPQVGRTFILEDELTRCGRLRNKFSLVKSLILDKSVLLVDDSIVRGTTSKEIIRMLRKAGARTVSLVTAAPPIKHPCHYGINIASEGELIAAGKTEEVIRLELGLDYLLYQEAEDLVTALNYADSAPRINPCMRCMNAS